MGLAAFVGDRADAWHKIGDLEATKKAAELLAKRGVIEVWPETNRYRLKKPKSHLA